MTMMTKLLPVSVALAILLCGCRPGDDDVRKIVREEMARAMQKSIISPVKAIGPYSPGVRVGNFLFVSGQIALDPETGLLKQDNIEMETRQVLDNLRRILWAAGFDSSHVVNATVYLKDMNDYQKMNVVYGGYFHEGSYPARVAVQVADLPRKANIEISIIAYKQ
jgi:2-iminobutanoate/2-iminopropanoate deaminase